MKHLSCSSAGVFFYPFLGEKKKKSHLRQGCFAVAGGSSTVSVFLDFTGAKTLVKPILKQFCMFLGGFAVVFWVVSHPGNLLKGQKRVPAPPGNTLGNTPLFSDNVRTC
jgi:hypothetical protein